jgi:hypothetical protein
MRVVLRARTSNRDCSTGCDYALVEIVSSSRDSLYDESMS